MPAFSRQSREKLDTCDERIQRVFERVIEHFDCVVLEGRRTEETQRVYVATGRSKTMNSKHLSNPSRAIDIAPYPIDWNDVSRFHLFAGFVLGAAAGLGIGMRWGGDWDRDTEVKDNEFDDLVHFELVDP